MCNKKSGYCLCGEVSFTVNNMSKKVVACHCNMCRRWGGGPYMEVSCGSEVLFNGEENIAVYSSSEWAERGFCKKCGSHLFYRLKETQEHQMPVGLFEDQEGLIFHQQVFIDEKPEFFSFSNETSNLTGAEVYAMYVEPQE